MTDNHPTPRIIRSRRKTVALIIDTNGNLIVRAPQRLSNRRIAEIIQEKETWIRTRQREMLNQQASTPVHRYLEGEEFWFLGNQYFLQLVHNPQKPLVLTNQFLLDIQYQAQAAQVFEAWYRQQARLILTERTNQLANRLGLKFSRLRLSSAQTRWGSCSSRGTISLVWRLVMAPLPVIDYVILHELTHLRIPNHSKAFWEQIATEEPDYRSHINWLKAHSHKMKL